MLKILISLLFILILCPNSYSSNTSEDLTEIDVLEYLLNITEPNQPPSTISGYLTAQTRCYLRSTACGCCSQEGQIVKGVYRGRRTVPKYILCRLAKRDASSQAPSGCRTGHCQPCTFY